MQFSTGNVASQPLNLYGHFCCIFHVGGQFHQLLFDYVRWLME
jgi:hypothetical protein